MKQTYVILTLLAALSLVSTAAPAVADTYSIDPVHTSVVFRVQHLGVTFVYGRFNGPEGVLVFDEASPEASSITMTVAAVNVDTAVEKRDRHLRSPDFFDAENHPKIRFESRSVKKVGENRYEITGDLTLLGTTRPQTVVAVHTGSGKDPWGGFRTGFETTFTIRRSEFGMNFMLDGVADEVTLTVSIEAVRK